MTQIIELLNPLTYTNGRRNKDWVLLSLIIFSDTDPRTVSVTAACKTLLGRESAKNEMTGIYGSKSRDAALFAAAKWTRENKTRFFILDLWAHIPDAHLLTSQANRELMEKSHWFHSGRIGSKLKAELKARACEHLAKTNESEVVAKAHEETLPWIFRNHPDCLSDTFAKEKDLQMVCHTVKPAFQSCEIDQEPTPIWCATIRLDRIELMRAEMRYLPDVQVVM